MVVLQGGRESASGNSFDPLSDLIDVAGRQANVLSMALVCYVPKIWNELSSTEAVRQNVDV